ncbi:MAG: TIGR03619 family F420-dependent LLM class oxidoreductase, partial [Actinomycetota bacterium]
SFSGEDPGGWDHLRTRVLVAEEAGIDRVVCSDHVVYGERLDAYGDPRAGGVSGGRQPTGPDGHWLEPLAVLTWAAALTERVRLGTNILIAALRRPAVLAKQVATLDVLSGGRVDLGVGVGWQREEYEAVGLPFERRGRLLDHTLAVCQTLWREPRAAYDDEHLRFEGIHQMPKPPHPGGVPIWVSGRLNGAVVRRLARFGSGWIPWGEDAANVVARIPEVKARLQALGREDADRLQVVGSLPLLADRVTVDVAAAEPLVAAGVTDFRTPLRLIGEREADLDLAGRAVESFRRAFGPGPGP